MLAAGNGVQLPMLRNNECPLWFPELQRACHRLARKLHACDETRRRAGLLCSNAIMPARDLRGARERAGRRLLGCHTRVVSHVCLGAQLQLPCNFAGKFDA